MFDSLTEGDGGHAPLAAAGQHLSALGIVRRGVQLPSIAIFLRYRESCSAIRFAASGVAFQTRAVLSMPPETIRLPSGLKATASTPAVWPRSVKTSWPVDVSQSLIVRSKLAVASRRPSGLNASETTSVE